MSYWCQFNLPFICNGFVDHTRLKNIVPLSFSDLYFCIPWAFIQYGIGINTTSVEAKLPGYTWAQIRTSYESLQKSHKLLGPQFLHLENDDNGATHV